MRKITSHYGLMPDGQWAKRPIIELDDKGLITNVRIMNDDFQEEPSLEYFPGVIVPAFIMAVQVSGGGEDRMFMRRCVASGVRRVVSNVAGKWPSIVEVKVLEAPFQNEKIVPWERVKEEVAQGISLAEAILGQTSKKAAVFNMEEKWGAIKKGGNPGLLLLKGLDLIGLKLTEFVSFKVIQD